MNKNLYILLKSIILDKDNNNNDGDDDDDDGNNGLDDDANNNKKNNVSSNITQNISNTNIMSEEIQQLLIEWNDTECQCYYLEEKLNTGIKH